MNWIVIGLGVIILPSILVLLTPLIDNILTTDVIEYINDIIDNIEFFIGSQNTNLLFGLIAIIIALPFIRRIIKFFTGDTKE